MTRLSYLDYQPTNPYCQPFTPTWEVMTKVSYIVLCFNIQCSVDYLAYVGSYTDSPKKTMFDSEQNF